MGQCWTGFRGLIQVRLSLMLKACSLNGQLAQWVQRFDDSGCFCHLDTAVLCKSMIQTHICTHPSLSEDSLSWSEQRSWIHLQGLSLSSDGFCAPPSLYHSLTVCLTSHPHINMSLLTCSAVSVGYYWIMSWGILSVIIAATTYRLFKSVIWQWLKEAVCDSILFEQ